MTSIEQPGSATQVNRARPRVVVGVDGSPGSRAALAQALLAAVRRGADVEVVSSYALETGYFGGAPLDLPDAHAIGDDLRARVTAMVAEVLDELAASFGPGIRDLDVHVVPARTLPAHALLERSEGAALLVVGSRGRGAMRSALLGSVALHCATHAACPVLVVHPTAAGARPTGQVLVGIDDSEGAKAALAAAVEEAARTGAEVEALVSYAAADYWTDLSEVVVRTPEEIRWNLEQHTASLAEEVLAPRRAASVPTVRTTVVEGPAGEVLVHAARSADLLVVGSRGRGAFRGLLLGSVALHCVMHAPCPVLVVHPQRSRSTAGIPRPAPAMADH